MVTLIRQKNSGSRRARVCSSRCYNAKGSVCVCICGGKNHGVGLEKATENTQQREMSLLKEVKT